MSLTKEILRITARYHPIGYAQLFEYLYEETVYGKKLNKRSVHTLIKRLEKRGFIKRGSKWSVTQTGKDFLTRAPEEVKKFLGDKSEFRNKTKKLIVIFDIPEKKKRYREWLRHELVGFDFTLIQKSVWFGPALPKEFLNHLNDVGILKHIRFFQVSGKDLL